MSINGHSVKYPTPAVSLTEHPAALPECEIPDDVDHAAISASGLELLPDFSEDDLTDTAIWRDSLAFTGTLRTFFKRHLILKVWRELCESKQPANFFNIPKSSHVMRLGPKTAWVEAGFTFHVKGKTPSRCSGTLGLVPSGNDQSRWKIWLLSTILEQPEGFRDVDDLQPVRSTPQSLNSHLNGYSEVPECVDCLVAGAGVAGLCMAARLQALGLSYVVVDKHATVGDVWKLDRYESLKLHTSKAYNQMPGYPSSFRPEDPYHLTTNDVAAGFQRYVKRFGIRVLSSTTLISGSYDQAERLWTLQLEHGGQVSQMRARHVVLAVGSMGVKPEMPSYPNQELFKGDIVHGLEWRNASRWQGKSGVVVGSANTAQGIIADMANADFKSVTMIQRSRTFLLPTFTFGALVDPVYNEDMPLELSDRILLGYPLPIQRLMAKAGTKMCAEQNPTYFERIEAGGFKTIRNGDLWGMMYDREGGHFFDLGAGEFIANGTVKVKSDALPVSYTGTGLEMSDGSYLDADVIVFATGYSGNIKDAATKMFGKDVGASLEEFWQCDKEGESRGAWKYVGRKCNLILNPRMKYFANRLSRPWSLVYWTWLRPRTLLLQVRCNVNQSRHRWQSVRGVH